MRYILDTNIWIVYLKQVSTPVRKHLERTVPEDIAVCSVVWAELLHGARKYERREEREARIEVTLEPFDCLPFDLAAARQYAVIRDQLEREGRIIGSNDLIIASIAVAKGLTLVTHNSDEFRRVPGLVVEDWFSS
jgi:tRNA(fMet)-specific endonuclease VapC